MMVTKLNTLYPFLFFSVSRCCDFGSYPRCITMIPVFAPVYTMGLTCIKVQLLKAEVVTAVTIRLHKPRDSTTIGLSQIILNGYTAFGETGASRQGSYLYAQPVEDYVSKTR